MPDHTQDAGRTCQVKTLPLATPEELAPLCAALRENRPLTEAVTFPRGTLLPDGRLDLCKQSLGPSGMRQVAEALRGNSQVKSLLLGADQLGPEGALAVAELLEGGAGLRTVFLGCNAIGPAGTAALCAALRENRTVQGLWLKRNELGPEGAAHLAALLQSRGGLHTLDLVTNRLGVEGIAVLVDALCAARGPLETLYVCGNQLGAAGALHVARLLKAKTPLRALYLAANHLGDAGAQILAEALGGSGLLRLGLASNDIGPAGVDALCAAQEKGAGLQVLDLGFAPATEVLDATPNRIGDEGARRLSRLLRVDTRLAELDLNRAGFGEEGAQVLLEGLEENRTLLRLKLAGSLPPALEQTRIALLCRNASSPQPLSPEIADIRSVYRTAQRPRGAASAGPSPSAPPLARALRPIHPETHGFDAPALEQALAVLRALSLRRHLAREDDPKLTELRALAARLARLERHEQKRSDKEERRVQRRQQDLSLLARTGLRRLRRTRSLRALSAPPALPAPEEAPQALSSARRCYICKNAFVTLHHFYDSLCPACAALNFSKRAQSADLRGRIALVTGGRIKIGFEVACKLLRAGARVLVTTRFPRDAARRFSQEDDFSAWAGRLRILGLDLRDLRAVERVTAALDRALPHLDVLINNAAQTVRKPSRFYAHLMEGECAPREQLPAAERALFWGEDGDALLAPRAPDALLSWAGGEDALLSGAAARDAARILGEVRDEHHQPLDLRETNSWRLRLAEVETPELLEVHLINAFAPFLLNRGLKAALLRSPAPDRYIVNVSAMEGQFYKFYKGPNHPHTNMAKAALNMMTWTSGPEYAESGIYMTSVDTGWITDENPFVISTTMAAQGFQPPLDEVDAAARILDPVFVGIAGGPKLSAVFLKDYQPTAW